MNRTRKTLFERIFVIIISILIPLPSVSEIIPTVFAEEIPVTDSEVSGELTYQTISASPQDGRQETITLDGMMPQGASVNVQNNGNLPENTVCAYDISITDSNGEDFQPESSDPINVEITDSAIEKAVSEKHKLRLWHIDDNGIREEIKNFEISGSSVKFETTGFSVFEIDDGTTPLRTYYFEIPENPAQNTSYKDYYFPTSGTDADENHKMICQQTVKDGEKPIFPQLPADMNSKYTFLGWFVSENGVLADSSYDFENIEPVTQDEEITLRAVFKSCVYVIFHDEYNGRTHTFPVIATRRGDLQRGSVTDVYGNPAEEYAEVKIDDLKVNYDDEIQAQGEPLQMSFKGWAVVPEQCETPEDINSYLESSYVQTIQTDTIKVSGITRLYPVFEPICWLEFNTNQSGPEENAQHYAGATYKPPLYFSSEEGFSFEGRTPPMLAGYTFDGWYAEGNVKVTDSRLNLVENLSTNKLEVRGNRLFFKKIAGQQRTVQVDLYAHWTPADSKYTVVIWRQKADDSPGLPQNQKSYDFAESFRLDAPTGNPVSVADVYKSYSGQNDYKGFTYSSCSPDTTVLGNGKTVLDVYYDRNVHTFTFNVNNRTVKTVTALYGSSVIDIFPIQGYESYIWSDSTNQTYNYVLATLETMPDSNVNFNGERRDISETIYYYVETDADDTEDFEAVKTFNGLTYGLYKTVRHGFNFLTYDEEYHPIEGYLRDRQWAEPYFGERGTNNAGGNINIAPIGGKTSDRTTETDVNYLYYNRDTFSAQFIDSFNDESIATENIKFRQKLENFIPADPTPPEGYEFTGWYTDIGCTTKVFFHEPSQEEIDATKDENGNAHYQVYKRMPAYNIRIYAGWQTLWFKIELDPNGGVLTGSQATWFWEPYNGDPIEEYNTATRNFEPDVNGEYYYALRNRDYYGLGAEWDPREDTEYKNQVINGHCTRGAFYTDNVLLATSLDRYRETDGAYRYLGWYEYDPVTGEEQPFSFGTHVTKNIYLRLHWKQLGTYYISYNAGKGTIDTQDSNERIFEFLDNDDYADHAEIVVTRVAVAPEGMNFVGWKIRNDPSDKIYYPGQSFQFNSGFASYYSSLDENSNITTKRIIVLDAVYREIKNAEIIYDPNGGTVDSRALSHAGGQDSSRTPVILTSGTEHPLTTEVKINNNQLVVSDLMNNSAVKLADGIGFENPGYTLVGWSTSPNGENGSFFKKDSIKCYVDTEEPLILYAQWELRVYFDKNNPNSTDWGGDWTESGFLWSEAQQRYYITARLGTAVNQPEYTPISSNSQEMFRYWSPERQSISSNACMPFDFDTQITKQLIERYGSTYTDSNGNSKWQLTLYGYWDKPVEIPIHIVDTSNEIWAKRDDWLKDGITHISLGNEEIEFMTPENAEVYADETKITGKEFAFACTAGNQDNDYLNISEDRKIQAVKYDIQDRKVKVKYVSDDSWYVFGESDAVYLVYYSNPRQIPIVYRKVSSDDSMTPVTVNSNAPTSATIDSSVFSMSDTVTNPISWASSYSYSPNGYSYAVGGVGEDNARNLHTITRYSESDTNRPNLQIKSTWQGFKCSLDGSEWYDCGYDIQLYVMYYESAPDILNLTEKTIGLSADMSTKFDYKVKIINKERTLVTRKYYYKSRYGSTYTEITDNDNFKPEIRSKTDTTLNELSEQSISLSDGQMKSFVLFSGEPISQTTGEPQKDDNDRTITIGRYSYEVWYRDITYKQAVQTAEIEQTPKTNYITTNDAEIKENQYKCSYTTEKLSDPVTITYTNRHLMVEQIHVAVAKNGIIRQEDSLRTEDGNIYSHTFGDTWNLSAVSAETLINDSSGKYRFGGIISGSENENNIVTPSESSVTTLSFGNTGGSGYEYYLNGDTAKHLGDNRIYFVYFEAPTVKYVLESPKTGELIPIEPLEKNGLSFMRDGSPIEQNEILPVSSDKVLLVSQVSTPANPAFMIPDLLDHNGSHSKLDLSQIGIRNSDGSMRTYRSETIHLCYADNALKYYFSDPDTLYSFSDELTVYAIYRIRGYALTLTKKVVGDAPPESSYTFKISSDSFADGYYYIGGYGDTEMINILNHETVLSLQRGGSVTIYGLSQGDYTVTEQTIGSYKMSVSVNGHSVPTSENTVAVHIDNDMEINVLNIYPIPVTGRNEQKYIYFLSVSVLSASAVLYFVLRRKEENF